MVRVLKAMLSVTGKDMMRPLRHMTTDPCRSIPIIARPGMARVRSYWPW